MTRPTPKEVWLEKRKTGFQHKQADILRDGGMVSVGWFPPSQPLGTIAQASASGLCGHRYDFRLEWRSAEGWWVMGGDGGPLAHVCEGPFTDRLPPYFGLVPKVVPTREELTERINATLLELGVRSGDMGMGAVVAEIAPAWRWTEARPTEAGFARVVLTERIAE